MEVYEYISESLMSTGDLILEYYPDLPLEFLVIPFIIFVGVYLKQRSRRIQQQPRITSSQSIRQYLSMLLHEKLFWHIRHKYQGKEIDLLAPQPYEERLYELLGTAWKNKYILLSDKDLYDHQISENRATEASILYQNQEESEQSDDDEVTSVTSMDSLETAIQSEKVITEINYESTASEAGDSDFRTAENIHNDSESNKQGCASDYGDGDEEDQDQNKVKEEELSDSICTFSEDSASQVDQMSVHTNELDQTESPQDGVSSPHCLETTGSTEVVEPREFGEVDEGSVEEDGEKSGEYIVNEESLPPPSDAGFSEEEAQTELETIAEEEEDNIAEP